MSANTVTVAASAVSATSTASLAATITITAASIRAAASIAASIAQRSHQWHSDAISMHVASTRWYTYGTIWNGTIVYHMYHIYMHRENKGKYKWYIIRCRREGGKGGGGKDDESKDGGPTQGAR